MAVQIVTVAAVPWGPPVPDLLLHHHEPSPFAEKIRLIMGLKGLEWASVQVPMVMPKPALTALTGGYRKTPVLQIGADIYCDTALIARELEARFPEPSLFPGGWRGLGYALGEWSDRALFQPGAGLSMGENPDIPEPVLADRKAFFEFMDFDRLAEAMPNCYAQFQAQCQLLEDELAANDADFLGGRRASWPDVLAYFPVWMAEANIPRAAELLAPFPAIRRWAARMAAVGHGERRDVGADEAHAIARAAEPLPGGGVAADPFHDFEAGDAVTVTPNDYGKDPVGGRLLTLDRRRIAVEREHDGLGRLAVHFPRAGFVVERAA